jgi:hypothetical protein
VRDYDLTVALAVAAEAQPFDFQRFRVVLMVSLHILGAAAFNTGAPYQMATRDRVINSLPRDGSVRVALAMEPSSLVKRGLPLRRLRSARLVRTALLAMLGVVLSHIDLRAFDALYRDGRRPSSGACRSPTEA